MSNSFWNKILINKNKTHIWIRQHLLWICSMRKINHQQRVWLLISKEQEERVFSQRQFLRVFRRKAILILNKLGNKFYLKVCKIYVSLTNNFQKFSKTKIARKLILIWIKVFLGNKLPLILWYNRKFKFNKV